MRCYVYVWIDGDDFDAEAFNDSLSHVNRGTMPQRRKIINGVLHFVKPHWKSKELEAFHEFPNDAGEIAIANLNGLLESLRDDLIELGKKVRVDVWVEIVTNDDLRFHEACKYPCDERQLELEECQAAGHHVCGQPFVRGGFTYPKKQ